MKAAKALEDPGSPSDQVPLLPRLRSSLTSDTVERFRTLGKNAARFFTNELIARWINLTYNSYSRFYEGQLRLGLPGDGSWG